MASYYFGHSFPRVFIGTGGLRTEGITADLKAGELGFFDKSTFSAIAPSAINTFFNRQFIIAQGSYHTKDSLTAGNLTDNFQKMKESVKTLGILPRYITRLEKVTPKRAEAESWVIGWDQITDCCAELECDSKYTVRIDAKGDAIRRLLNRDWYKEFVIETECCEGCETCSGSSVPRIKYFQDLANQVNEDPIAKKFLKASLVYDLTACPIEQLPYTKYCLDICDAGDILALASVQAQYPTETIKREKRDGENVENLFDQTQGSISSYTFCSNEAPEDFQPTAFSIPADCKTCPDGYTINLDPAAGPFYKFVVSRPIAGDDDLSTETAAQAFADALAVEYGGETPAEYLGQTGAVALVSFVVNKATYDAGVVALLSDSIEEKGVSTYTCTPEDPALIAWAECGEYYKTTRRLCITLSKDCDPAVSRLDDVIAAFNERKDVVTDSIQLSTVNSPNSNDCAEIIEITQISNECLEDGCNTKSAAQFDELPSFEGHVWAECPCVEENDCDTCVGVKIETAFVEPKFGNCSFSPMDHYNLDGIRLEISLKDDADLCEQTRWPVRKLTSFKAPQGLGESVLRKYLLSNGYRLPEEQFEYDLRMREVIDQQHLNVVDRSAYYKRITLSHYIPHNAHAMGMTGLSNDQSYSLDFYFEEGADTSQFEQMIQGLAGSAGVTMDTY